jgi:leucine-rich repeat protein SHOC2
LCPLIYVSNNRVTGPIPHENQFETFLNSLFGGNLGLWQSPLSKKCRDFKYTPTLPSPFKDNQSSKPLFEFGWKVIVIGYVCGFMIGVIVGKLWLQGSKDGSRKLDGERLRYINFFGAWPWSIIYIFF